MKRFKFLFAIWAVAVIMNIMGGISTAASLGTKQIQQDNVVICEIRFENCDEQGWQA